ncbi:FAD-dependent monooxygenase [Neomegalonema sp.]|uniref:FAD-dependent monooxygenase n=1 Tax=Neomegalonema sp. TaxID=2039713 RepID=UPI00262AF59C|nr:FAD-dependent monooxygenase [Neomegalonema sp.]MDD2867073.1 FAD-dependent monooxygenase [Neomegalonema sp.]
MAGDLETEILVVGGGPAGLILTARLTAMGRSVICVERAPPPADPEDPAADLRTTAFLRPSVETLRRAGVWEALAPLAAPLRIMRIVQRAPDAGKPPRVSADFTPPEEEAGGPFGSNIPNAALRLALTRVLAERPGARLLAPMTLEHWIARFDGVRARLSDGRTLRARLLVAADGRESEIRRAAGIGVRRVDYEQKALVAALAHEGPHGYASSEIHSSGGPLTFTPLRDPLRSGLVWMTPNLKAARLMALSPEAFEAELQAEAEAADLALGRIRLLTRRAAWPIVGQLAERLQAPRLALIAEAAHVVPPIGAQGMNMSLRDVEVLAEELEKAPDPGAPSVLEAYERRRLPDLRLRGLGVGLLNRAAKSESRAIRDLRAFGLAAIRDLTPLRRTAVRLGLGEGG